MRTSTQKICRRAQLASFLTLGGAISLLALGACAHRQLPVATQLDLAAPGAQLTQDTRFVIDTKVFLVKRPGSVSALTPYYTAGTSQTRVLSASAGKALVAGLAKNRHVTKLENGGSVMTVPGQPAVCEAIRELIHPVEYDPPQVPKTFEPSRHAVFPVTPAHPVSFETKNCGFQSRVTPILKPGGVLEVDLSAESRTFDGFVNYGSPISTVGKDWLGNPVNIVLTENRVQMPVFTMGKVASRVRVSPTDFVVITGLPQGKPLNAKLQMPGFVSDDPISNTEARKPYQLVVVHEILALAE